MAELFTGARKYLHLKLLQDAPDLLHLIVTDALLLLDGPQILYGLPEIVPKPRK